jgi:hypothetical protein
MKIRPLLFVLLVSVCISCANSKNVVSSGNKASNSSMSAGQAVEPVPNDQRDGSSFEKAIVLNEKSTGAGIKAEYAWVKEKYPDSKVVKQALMHKGKRSYDVLTVQKAAGGTEEVYFDITSFYGKW